MDTKNFYNELYSHQNNAFGKTDPFIQDMLEYKSQGTVLDLGAGEGRNALFLASKGFDVTAVDLSEIAIEKIKKSSDLQGIKIQAFVQDLNSFEFAKNFDVITSSYVFHLLNAEAALDLIANIKLHTAEKGLNILTVFTKDGDFFRNNPYTDKFYALTGELSNLYSDWNILKYEEKLSRAFQKRPDGSPMFNIAARIIAQKP